MSVRYGVRLARKIPGESLLNWVVTLIMLSLAGNVSHGQQEYVLLSLVSINILTSTHSAIRSGDIQIMNPAFP
jgi:hypothetical protein